jgi:hypothetical protein
MSEYVIRSADDLVEAFRIRKAQLGISNETVEDALLLAHGVCDKYLGPSRTKGLSATKIEDLMTLFGVELVMRVNPDLEAKMQDRWQRRGEQWVRPQRRLSKELLAVARTQIYKELSALGNEARRAKVSSKARSRIARAAATCRWKHRASEGAQA